MYLDSTSAKSVNDCWLIDSGTYFHMFFNKEWFREYERYNGGDVLLGVDSPTKIIEGGKVKLLLKDGRIRTFHVILHIPNLERNLISISTMSDAVINIVFEKEKCKMV